MPRFPPFDDDNPIGVCTKILNGKITFPQNFDAATKDIVRSLCHEDVNQRLGCGRNGFRDIKVICASLFSLRGRLLIFAEFRTTSFLRRSIGIWL